MTSEHTDEYYIPLVDQRVFGAGIKRKRVPFVPAGSDFVDGRPGGHNPDLSDRYLSIVLPPSSPPPPPALLPPTSTTAGENDSDEINDNIQRPTLAAEDSTHRQPKPESPISASVSTLLDQPQTCAICNLTITSPKRTLTTALIPPSSQSQKPSQASSHCASIVHQICLPHSHPPSHLSRDHIGLKYLSSYGWDPDGRVGLGAKGKEGVRAPVGVKNKVKRDTVGLGVELADRHGGKARAEKKVGGKGIKEKSCSLLMSSSPSSSSSPRRKQTSLNAKQIRQRQKEEQKRDIRLRELFYGPDLEAYLGAGG